MTSSVERKRNTASVISDAKPEVQSKPEYFHLSICVEGPASTDDSALSSLASRVVREAENLYTGYCRLNVNAGAGKGDVVQV